MTNTPLYLGQALGKLGYDISIIRRASWTRLNKLCKDYCLMNGQPLQKLDSSGRTVYETENDFLCLEDTASIFIGTPEYLMPLCRK